MKDLENNRPEKVKEKTAFLGKDKEFSKKSS